MPEEGETPSSGTSIPEKHANGHRSANASDPSGRCRHFVNPVRAVKAIGCRVQSLFTRIHGAFSIRPVDRLMGRTAIAVDQQPLRQTIPSSERLRPARSATICRKAWHGWSS